MKFSFDHALISQGDLLHDTARLYMYREHLSAVLHKKSYEDPECSLYCPFDRTVLEEVKTLVAQKVTNRLKYIFLIGIGGSNLGAKAVYDAMGGFFDTVREDQPKIIFLDTVHDAFLAKMSTFAETFTDAEEMLLIAISKSGGTTETVTNTEILLAQFFPQFPNILDRLVIITDEGSPFWNVAVEKGISLLSLPKLVGGRYSVFSSVGLLPLLAAGINIELLLDGACDMAEQCVDKDPENNPAMAAAIVLYQQLQQGKTMHNLFFFNPELESLGKWYRQLMGESIGKEKDRTGADVHVGITPIVSIGSTDLHSVGQLYLGGPNDKVTTFIYAEGIGEMRLPTERIFPTLVSMVTDRSAREIMMAIFDGVSAVYTQKQLPFMHIDLDVITERGVGEFMQWSMVTMMYLAELLNINAFDQPNVESYKEETRKKLESV